MFLRHWWSEYYNKPIKDPLLDSYTLEELTYEYYDKIERHNAIDSSLNEESDRIEDEVLQDNLDWAEAEEAKEREEMLKQMEAEKEAEETANQKWMDEELEKAKLEHGEDYGEDLNLDFSK